MGDFTTELVVKIVLINAIRVIQMDVSLAKQAMILVVQMGEFTTELIVRTVLTNARLAI